MLTTEGLFIHSNFHHSVEIITRRVSYHGGDFNEEFAKGTNKIIGFVCSLRINLQKLIHSIPIFMRICFLRLMDPYMKIELLLYACGFMFAPASLFSKINMCKHTHSC